jgi:hypothetical protein
LCKPCFGAKEVMINQCFIDPLELMKSKKESVTPLTAKPRLRQKVPKKVSLFYKEIGESNSI